MRTIKFQYGTPLGRSPFPHIISIMTYLPSTSFSWRPLGYFEAAVVRLYKEEIGSYSHSLNCIRKWYSVPWLVLTSCKLYWAYWYTYRAEQILQRVAIRFGTTD